MGVLVQLEAGSVGRIAGGASAATDREAAPFAFLLEAKANGVAGALLAICGIDGGAPRALGAHMAVLADGRHLGHVSGGCVEPAIAAEVAPVIAAGSDRIIRFGKGSCYLDIRFPCGGGVDLLAHADPGEALLRAALDRFQRREPFSIAFDPSRSQAAIALADGPTAWQGGRFVRRYLPKTRLLLVGRGPDVEVMARVALASELEVSVATPDQGTAQSLAALGLPVTLLTSPREQFDLPIDRWTATVLLFHEREWEDPILSRAASMPGFYLGALGSVRTHGMRRERLAAMGVPAAAIERIRGPIGLVDRAREPGTLALSVLAEIATVRAALDRA